MTTPNPILRELHTTRDEILAEFGGDLSAYIQSAERRALASGHPIAHRRQFFVRAGIAVSRDVEDATLENQPTLSVEH